MRLLILSSAVVAVILAWWLGRDYGIAREREAQDVLIAGERGAWLATRNLLESESTGLRIERDVARETVATLRLSLDTKQRLSIDDMAELQLYRRIEGADGHPGLSVDEVQIFDGEPASLHITLVQARGRDRVTGTLGITLIGEQAGKSQRQVIVSAAAADAPGFDLRFFKTVIVPFEPALAAEVDLLEIDIKPRGKPHKPFQLVLPWGEIPRVRP
jgi:hypothetical protein